MLNHIRISLLFLRIFTIWSTKHSTYLAVNSQSFTSPLSDQKSEALNENYEILNKSVSDHSLKILERQPYITNGSLLNTFKNVNIAENIKKATKKSVSTFSANKILHKNSNFTGKYENIDVNRILSPSSSNDGSNILHINRNIWLPSLNSGEILSDHFAINFQSPRSNISSKNYRSVASSLHPPIPNSTPQIRSNVVDEVPALDVGPLSLLSVKEGSSTRVPCSPSAFSLDDTIRLVLWYRNDTSRPLLSYDARKEQKLTRFDIFSRSKESFQRRDFVLFHRAKWHRREPKISLGRGGQSLVIWKVEKSDQAEYRCTVHYKRSPAVTHRIQLMVNDQIDSVHMYDSAGKVLGSNFGPYAVGSAISIECRSNCPFGKILKNLKWLFEEDVVKASNRSLAKNNGSSNVTLILKKMHAHGTMTCRSTCEYRRKTGEVERHIADRTTLINMRYVPQSRLFIDVSRSMRALSFSEEVNGGSKIEVLEGESLTFICLTKANPSPYNITWLYNGQLFDLSAASWSKENNSLTISYVDKKDSGLYTCLASNVEGDGESNAINIRVAYPPSCSWSKNKHIVVKKRIPVRLECQVDAYPSNVTFSWRRTSATLRKDSQSISETSKGTFNGKEIKIPNSNEPFLIELSPDLESRSKNAPVPQGPPLPHREDLQFPLRSRLTIVPDSKSVGIVCFSRNKIGHSQLPCVFTISVLDDPLPSIGCHINSVAVTSLKVECKLRTSNEQSSPLNQTPGLSPVRSPRIKGAVIMEVWNSKELVANETSDRGLWYIEKLPPSTDLRLKIYSYSTKPVLEPINLFARTLALEDNSISVSDSEDKLSSSVKSREESKMEDKSSGLSLFIIIGIIVLVVSFLSLIVLTALIVVKTIKNKRKTDQDKRESTEGGEGDPWIGVSFRESYDTIVTSPL